MVTLTEKVIQELTSKILNPHYSTPGNPLQADGELTDDILKAAKILQELIDTKNQKYITEVNEIEADQKKMLAVLADLNKTSQKKNYFSGFQQEIDQMQLDIDRLQTQQAENREIYITLMKKTKDEIWKKIKELKDGGAAKHGEPQDISLPQAKKLEFRYSSDYPVTTEETHFPPVDKLNFDNYLVAVS